MEALAAWHNSHGTDMTAKAVLGDKVARKLAPHRPAGRTPPVSMDAASRATATVGPTPDPNRSSVELLTLHSGTHISTLPRDAADAYYYAILDAIE